jgi:hypothetical protein
MRADSTARSNNNSLGKSEEVQLKGVTISHGISQNKKGRRPPSRTR